LTRGQKRRVIQRRQFTAEMTGLDLSRYRLMSCEVSSRRGSLHIGWGAVLLLQIARTARADRGSSRGCHCAAPRLGGIDAAPSANLVDLQRRNFAFIGGRCRGRDHLSAAAATSVTYREQDHEGCACIRRPVLLEGGAVARLVTREPGLAEIMQRPAWDDLARHLL
jgi:hypothetical protein